MLSRRAFLERSLIAGGFAAAASPFVAQQPRAAFPFPVIDAHCHAGKGMNYGKDDPFAAPWTTFNDPERVLRQADAAGISQTIIFPISNLTYEQANAEIAGYVRRWPAKFIGFAKHDPKTEAGKIRDMLIHEIRDL